jgi:hypothetical protein
MGIGRGDGAMDVAFCTIASRHGANVESASRIKAHNVNLCR